MSITLTAKFIIMSLAMGNGEHAAENLECTYIGASTEYPKRSIVDCTKHGDAVYSEFNGTGVYAQVFKPRVTKSGKRTQKVKFYAVTNRGALVQVRKPSGWERD